MQPSNAYTDIESGMKIGGKTNNRPGFKEFCQRVWHDGVSIFLILILIVFIAAVVGLVWPRLVFLSERHH